MITIKVNKEDYGRLISAISNVKKVAIDMCKSIPEESAREFANKLTENIVNQTYPFAPYRSSTTKGSRDWKRKFATSKMFWNWLGTTLKSITYWRISASDKSSIMYKVGLRYKKGGAVGSTSSEKAPSVKKNVSKPENKPFVSLRSGKYHRDSDSYTTTKARSLSREEIERIYGKR